MTARQQLNWQWAQSLIGLQLKVPGCKFLETLSTFVSSSPPRSSLTDHIKYRFVSDWWASTPGDKSFHDAQVTRIDRQDKYGRHFVIHCQDGHDYSMRYDAVREYHRPNQRRIQNFNLPIEPLLEDFVAQRKDSWTGRQREERPEPTAPPGNTNPLLVWSSDEDAELSMMVNMHGKSWKACLDNSAILRDKFRTLPDRAGQDRLRRRWQKIATKDAGPRRTECDPSVETAAKVKEPDAPVENSLLIAPSVKVERRLQVADSGAKNASSASSIGVESLVDSREKRVTVASKVVAVSTPSSSHLEPCKYYDSQRREVEFDDDGIILYAQCDATYRDIMCDHFAMICPRAGTKLSATSEDHLQGVAEEAANAIRLKCGRVFKVVSLARRGESCGLCFVQVACMDELVRREFI